MKRPRPDTTATFRVSLPIEITRKLRSPPPYQRPVEISCFSFDEHRALHVDDDRSLAYFYPPDLSVREETDLNRGFQDKYIKRDESKPEHLDGLLASLLKYRKKSLHDRFPKRFPEDSNDADLHDGMENIQIITWRGIITKLCCTPYFRRESWSLNAVLFDGAIYIDENKTFNNFFNMERMTHWGYRFETLSTISCHPNSLGPNFEPVKFRESRETDGLEFDLVHDRRNCDDFRLCGRVNNVVNTNIQYGTVVRTRLGRHGLIIGAEVDCISDSKVPNDPCRNYVELKTSKEIENEREKNSFERFKLMKIYFQSFLAGVPTVVVGFRDNDGFLKNIKAFSTMKLPRVARKRSLWDPNVSLHFVDELFTWFQQEINEEDNGEEAKDRKVYRIEFKEPFDEIKIRRIEDQKLAAEIAEALLPTWYRYPFDSEK